MAETADQLGATEAEAAVERGRRRDLDSVIVEYELKAKEAADE